MPNHVNLNYHVNSKSGVNFVVASKHTCAKETHKTRHACTFNTVLFFMNNLFTCPISVLFMPVKLVFTVSYYILPVP